MGEMAQVREQAAAARRGGDARSLAALRERQVALWGRVEALAVELIARGEAPAGMVERLRVALEVPVEGAGVDAWEERRAA